MEKLAGVDAGGSAALRSRSRPRRRVSVLGVIGELLITAGVITLLYVVWQLWVGDLIYGAQRFAESEERSQQWAQEYVPPAATPDAETEPATVEPVALPEPADAEVFGIMRIPRFGADYSFDIAGGVTRARTLDPIGVGHYPGTSMPGQTGNFALAAHRTTWGAPFNRIAELRIGDPIVVETPNGWYTYRFRTLEYVTPDEVDVLQPVPQAVGVEAGSRYITLTSCSPMFSMAERIVAYGVFDSYTPRGAGPPASLTEGI
ncbi:class E sortase [Microbacterium sp. SLBN-146]|uniref:class E sortase n=1 Tax=Microbacterium sp. SLBN-146 TaxID=2768457 RepID=UPI00117009E2|nr:class E sortase [Microbacterium sp. SLBN-146]TQJ30389.1 sortase A [Microbacterium sp. SLBN-146]